MSPSRMVLPGSVTCSEDSMGCLAAFETAMHTCLAWGLGIAHLGLRVGRMPSGNQSDL